MLKVTENDKWEMAERTTKRRDEKAMEVLAMLIARVNAERIVTDPEAPARLAAAAYEIANAMRRESADRFKGDLAALDRANGSGDVVSPLASLTRLVTLDPERSIASSIEDDLTRAFTFARAQGER